MSVNIRFNSFCLYMICVLATTVFFSGCVAESESLHEHGHVEPRHWPSSIVQAADYIEQRLAELQAATDEPTAERRSVLLDELNDLVEWSPEVAADSDLPEAKWIPIYEISETIRGHLSAGDSELKSISGEFEELTTLLRAAGEEVAKLEAAKLDEMSTDLGGMEDDGEGASEADGEAEVSEADDENSDTNDDPAE
ncbi:MAG: hypothetical protein AAGG44_15170 [Planctomycetota bacterium]